MYFKTLKVRVKDRHAPILREMAFQVNQLWNACNAETAENCYIPVPEVGYMRVRITSFDLEKIVNPVRKQRCPLIIFGVLNEVCRIHYKSRRDVKSDKLRWRSSGGSRRALGWVPFRKDIVKWKDGQIFFAGHYFKCWDSYGLSQYEFKNGSFSEDARGRWYFNIVVEDRALQKTGKGQVGVDLGLKDTATCSNGYKLPTGRFYRDLESKLGIAQRANNKNRIKAIHAKIKNLRNDAIHKFTTKLVKENELIAVGNVSSSKLAKTKMAKSVLDAGWYTLKTQLHYKSKAMGVEFVEVDEAYTTQACSSCGALSSSSPKGRAGLGIREWECAECGATHDRDVNAAINILALGHQRLAGGTGL